MARQASTRIKEASFGLPPMNLAIRLCNGIKAIPRIKPHRMMLVNGNKIIRHQPMMRARNSNRIEVS